jgi:outer membrane receptor protein involved in Fe transport
VQNYTGQNQLGTKVLDNDEVINDSKLFPTASLIYSLSDNQNLRFSFSQTTARPSFKELSFAQIFDPVSDIYFIGGLNDDIGLEDGEEVVYWDGNLTVSDIQNFDIRWELFQEGGQMVSVSAFYKTFVNPIELVQLASSTQKTQVQPRNVGDGQVMGAEFEARKNLAFISDALTNFSVMANFTYTQSRIKMSDTEYEDRLRTARTGQNIEDYRDMAGQAPYIINAGLSYTGGVGAEGFRKGLEAGFYYNMQGLTFALCW